MHVCFLIPSEAVVREIRKLTRKPYCTHLAFFFPTQLGCKGSLSFSLPSSVSPSPLSNAHAREDAAAGAEGPLGGSVHMCDCVTGLSKVHAANTSNPIATPPIAVQTHNKKLHFSFLGSGCCSLRWLEQKIETFPAWYTHLCPCRIRIRSQNGHIPSTWSEN